jgi:hypothetical protein
MYQGNIEGSIYTGLASAIPGDLAGLEALHMKYGVGISKPCPRLTLTLYSKAFTLASSRQSCCSRCRIWLSRYGSRDPYSALLIAI